MKNKVNESVKILRDELLNHGDLYQGFWASIKSALDDANNYTPNEKLADEILVRVIGG